MAGTYTEMSAHHGLTALQRILDRLGVMPEQAMCSRWQRTAVGPSHDASCIKATGLGISPVLHNTHAVANVLVLVLCRRFCCHPHHQLQTDWGGLPQGCLRRSGEGSVPCLYVTCHSMSKPRHGTPEARSDWQLFSTSSFDATYAMQPCTSCSTPNED